MSGTLQIDDATVYTDRSLRSVGLTETALARARKSGHLRYTRPGNRMLYLGVWVREWLEAGASNATGNEETRTRGESGAGLRESVNLSRAERATTPVGTLGHQAKTTPEPDNHVSHSSRR